MYEFIEINDKAKKFYMKKWRDVPPGNLSDKITMAIDMGIPVEYLISQSIITPDNLGTFATDDEVHEKILAYMVHIGLIESKDKVTAKPVSVSEKPVIKEGTKDLFDDTKVTSSKDAKDTVLNLENELKQLQAQLDSTLQERDEKEQSIKLLETENKNLKDEIKDYSKNIEILHDEIENSYKSSGVSQDKIDLGKRERIQLQEDLKEANKKISTISDKLEKVNSELESEKDKSYELSMEIDRINRSIEQKSKEVIKKTEEMIKLKEENLDYRTKLSIADEKAISLEIQLKKAQEMLGSNDQSKEIVKLNSEIDNLKKILSEKTLTIESKNDKIESLLNDIALKDQEHAKEIQSIQEANLVKLDEYRKMMSNNSITVETADDTVKTDTVDITRARVDGKKIVSIIGDDILNLARYIDDNDNIFVANNVDDADLYLLMTDLTKESITAFKKNVRKYEDSIKVLVNWVDALPFSIKSVTGTNMDVIIRNTTDKFKDTWVDQNSYTDTWKSDLNNQILSKLGVN